MVSRPSAADRTAFVGLATSALLQEGEGAVPQLETTLPVVLIFVGIILMVFAIVGHRIRRIAVVEFFEPTKKDQPEKQAGRGARWEQIALGGLGAILLIIGLIWWSNPPGVTEQVKDTCPQPSGNAASIRVRRVAKACGCSAADFGPVEVDSPIFPLTGEWFGRQPNTSLWALLFDESDVVLRAVPVGLTVPDQPVWNARLTIRPEEDGIGRNFSVSVLVLDQAAADALQTDSADGLPITMPAIGVDQPHEDVVIQRVEVIQDQYSICERAP